MSEAHDRKLVRNIQYFLKAKFFLERSTKFVSVFI